MQISFCLTAVLLLMAVPGIHGLELIRCRDLSSENRAFVRVGSISGGDKNLLRKLYRVRSKVECATICYSEEGCKVSSFKKERGECNLLGAYFTDLSVKSYEPVSDIIVFDDYALSNSGCPADGCSGNQTCRLDCTVGEGMEPNVSKCVDGNPSMYDQERQKITCNEYPTFKFKEFYLQDFSYNLHSGVFFTMVFNKLFDWTALRLTLNGSIRGGLGGWNWLRIYINSELWSSPSRIEHINYNEESDINHRKSTTVMGFSYDVPSGDVQIELRTEPSGSCYAQVGEETKGTRLYVEELGHRGYETEEYAVNSPCTELPSYNHKLYYSTSSWSNDYGAVLMNYLYLKREDETTLKINTDVVMRMATANTGTSFVCAIWYLKVDGEQCSPQPIGRILSNNHNANLTKNEYRSSHIEGYCRGITKGNHYISLVIDRCPFAYNGDPVGDANTGWNGCTNRVMVEEIHENTDTAAVLGPDGKIYQIPEFNFMHWAYGRFDNDANSGEIVSFTYEKKYSTSGLRIVYNGAGRDRGYRDLNKYDPCCRHYFTINGSECTTPGPIEGISAINVDVNIHRTVNIDGICEGIDAGTITITVNAGKCQSYTKLGECYIGWNSYSTFRASETFVEREIATYQGAIRTN